MACINVYTCTQSELVTFHQIGATSSAKIVELCDVITVVDLSENHLKEEQWQSSIDQGDLSLELHATGHFTDTSPNTKNNNREIHLYNTTGIFGKMHDKYN